MEELLKDRHNIYLEYEEPWTGLSVDNNPVDVYVTIRMSVHDAVNFERNNQREREKKKGYNLNNFSISDIECLDLFIINNYARII